MAKVNLLLTGDFMLHSRYDKIANSSPGPAFVFDHVSPFFEEADIVFINLEVVLSEKGTPADGKLCLRGSNKYISQFKKQGVQVVSLANNHACDFGLDALTDMQNSLETLGIKTAGAGADLISTRKLQTIEIGDITFGFLAYSARTTNGSAYAENNKYGVAPLEEKIVLDDISRYGKLVDHLVLSLHWGVEYAELPTPDQRNLGRKFIDAGASVIYGHHPHILQGYERWNNGIIFYSLGNFCDSDLSFEGTEKQYQATLKTADRETILVHLDFDKNQLTKVTFTPLWLNDAGQPEIAAEAKKKEIEHKFSSRSEMIVQDGFETHWEQIILDKRIGGSWREWMRRGSIFDKIKNFKLSQVVTLYQLMEMFIKTKFSKSPDKYFLINPGDDKKPRPYCGNNKDE